GADINTSDQVTVTHLAAALPVNQGGTGTTATLTGLVRGNASAMTAAELSADATTSGSNAVTVVALRGAALPTLASSTGLLYDTAGTLSLPATLPIAAMPALTGDVTGTGGSLSVTVTKINGTLFTGTANDVVAFGTGGNIPLDTAILYTNLVTAAANYTSGDLVKAAGSNKTTSDSGILATNVVTAAANSTSGDLVRAAGANKFASDSGVV